MVDKIEEECGHKWAMLFKFCLSLAFVLLPLLATLMAWQTQQIHGLLKQSAIVETRWQALLQQGLYTHKDAASDKSEIRMEFSERLQKWAQDADKIYMRRSDR